MGRLKNLRVGWSPSPSSSIFNLQSFTPSPPTGIVIDYTNEI
ncbi:MAG: hypothetical protein PHU23_00560 [Dehalococcoidales bacterium]|nr:hypothetical protein [Dehalococcoidales bacterium]